MQRYLNFIESTLADERERYFASIQGIEDEDREEIIDMLYDELIEIRDEFPRMTYSSFLVTWFNLIEHELIKICETKELSINVKIHDQERFNTGIQRAYTFLKEGANYKIPDLYWQELSKIREIRNKIVHADGRIKTFPMKPSNGKKTISINISEDENEEYIVYTDLDEDLYNYLEQHAMIEYQGAVPYINPTFEYCLGLVEFGRSLFAKIYEDLGLK